MKKYLFKLSILLAVLIGTSFSIQNSINETDTCILSGKVTNTETGEQLPFASIKVTQKGKVINGTDTDFDGNYRLELKKGVYDIEASYIGFTPQRQIGVVLKNDMVLNFGISEGTLLSEVVVTALNIVKEERSLGYSISRIDAKDAKSSRKKENQTTHGKTVTSDNIRSLPTRSVSGIAATSAGISTKNSSSNKKSGIAKTLPSNHIDREETNRESYSEISENNFKSAKAESFSTFSIDVDRAAYSNVRRYISRGIMPPKDAVRIEEMINYFDYDYPAPKTKHPFELHSTLTECPWNENHQILHVGLQGKEVDRRNLPPTNLVFLLDVSGSMNSPNKLPLVKESLKLLLTQLNDNDRIAMVVYAGASGLVLPSTPVKDSKTILGALDKLRAGGGTAGAEGIELAYKVASENFRKNGNNRVILCTDGDFNIGVSSDRSLVKLIEEKRESGVFLSVLGFGMGNYQEGKMQKLSSAGNGNHFYIDGIQEAKKVFISEFAGSLYAIAKDVKIQLEFNADYVEAYRLIGYENRMLEKKDFEDDKKDAGELGIGHTVTALYEIIPKGTASEFLDHVSVSDVPQDQSDKVVSDKELGHIKFRYKKPDGKKSILIEESIGKKSMSLNSIDDRVKMSLAVAEFGLLLRDSKFKENADYDHVISFAKKGMGKDPDGYKKEFISLVEKVKNISGGLATK